MKINLNNNGLCALEAETKEESFQLQEVYFNQSRKEVRYYNKTGKRNAWFGKHKQQCPVCQKWYKNLRLHILNKHPEHYRDQYGDMTMTGKPIEQGTRRFILGRKFPSAGSNLSNS